MAKLEQGKKWGYPILLFLALYSTGYPILFAQSFKTQQYEVRFLGISDGLSSRNINQIFEDRRGMIWAATEQGLDIFNGQRFQPFNSLMPDLSPLPGRVIHHLAEDEDQRLWVCTSGGTVVWDAHRRLVVPFSQIGIPDSLSRNSNFVVATRPAGGLWILSGKILYAFYKKKGRAVLRKIAWNPYTSIHIPNIIGTNKGECWILDKIHGLSRLEGNRFVRIDGQEFPYPGNLYPKVTMTAHLGDSLTIFRNFQHTVFEIRKAQGRYFASPQQSGLSEKDPRWTYILDFLKQNPVIAGGNLINPSWISKDYNGAFWYATNIGIFLIRSRRGLNFQQIEITKKNSIRGIWGDKNGLRWAGAYSGAYYFPESGAPEFFPQLKAIWKFLPDGPDRFWLARESEISPQRIRMQNGKFTLDSLPTLGFILNICHFGNNLLAGGNAPYISVLDRTTGKMQYQIALKGKKSAYDQVLPAAKIILSDNDSSAWVGGNAGLFHLVFGKNGRLQQDPTPLPREIAPLPINALHLDKWGNLWIGTSTQGLFRFDKHSRKVKNYLAVDGLAHDIVYSIQGSHSDSLLWIGTQKGLSCFNVASESFYNYFVEDGLADNEFNTSASWKSPDGYLYMGGINGITYFKPQKPKMDGSRAGVFLCLDILDLRKEGTKMRQFPISGDTLNLYSFNKYLDIGFQSSAHFDSEEIIYRFKIINQHTTNWQYIRAGEKLILNHLPAGTNRILAQARMPAGNWGPIYKLNLRVFPPWYKSWWFNAFVILLCIATAYSLMRLRLQKYRREYDLRKKISADLHDEFGGRLYALNVLAHQINAPGTPESEIPRLFRQFQELSVETLRTARNFIWAFNPGTDQLGNLTDRMEDFCNAVLMPIVPAIRFECSPMLPYNKRVNAKTKHYALMIFQEVLTNMVKHSKPESIHVFVYLKDKSLAIKISNFYQKADSGPRDEVFSSGNGLQNIQNRRQAIRAGIEVKDNGEIQEVLITIRKW